MGVQQEHRPGEAKFRALLEAVPDAMAVTDRAGRVSLANSRVESMFGYCAPDLAGLPVEALVPERFHSVLEQEREACFRNPRQARALRRAELWGRHKDGTEFPIEVTHCPLETAEGTFVTTSFRDVDERHRTEQALRESEARFRVLFNQTFGFRAILDPEGIVLDINDPVLERTGVTRDEVLGRPIWETQWWNEMPDVKQALRSAVAGAALGRVVEGDHDYRSGDGTLRNGAFCIAPIRDSSRRVIYVSVEGRDITERRLAAEALRQSERRFQAIFNQAFGAFVLLTPDGMIIDVNRAAVDATGWPREQLIGLPAWNAPFFKSLPQAQAQLKQGIADAAGGRPVRFECPYRPSGGMQRISDYTLTPFRDADGETAFVIAEARDVTRQKKTERTLQRARDAHLSVLQDFPLLIWRTNIDARCDYVNETWIRFTGLTAEQAFGRGWLERIHPDDRASVEVEFRRAFDRREPFEMEYRLRRHDGAWRWMIDWGRPLDDLEGRFAGYIGAIRDITKRRDADRALRESEAQLRTLVEHAPEAIVVLDLDTGCFSDVNENAERMFGRSKDELCRIGPAEVSPPEQPDGRPSAEAATERIREAMDGAAPVFEWTHRDTDGRDFPCEIRLVRLPASGRRLVRGSVADISDRKRADEAKRLLEEQLRQSQKMETVGQLAGGIAHDFNNLLLAILGYSDLALDGLAHHEARFDHLQEIKKAGERAAGLTRKMLAFSRRQVIQPEPLQLNDSIRELMKLLRRLIPESVELDFRPGPELGTVFADPGQFEHVVVNLCINARDALPGAGRITIGTSNVELNEDFAARDLCVSPGPHVMLTISDTGCGMPPDVQERIFEPFFTTKPPGAGTGLGLSMVYGIVKQHEGAIRVQSAPEQGSTFRIYLPVVDQVARQPTHTAREPKLRGSETVLVVEDEEMVRKLAVRILDDAGYTVLEASDGRAAVAEFEAHAAEVSLVLLDVVMPRLGGREVYDAIRAARPEAKVLFTSGYSFDGIDAGFVLERGLDLLPKPYTPDVLLRSVRRVLDGGAADDESC